MKTKLTRSWDYNRLALLSAFAIALGYLQASARLYVHRILGIGPLAANFDPNVLQQAPDWLISSQQTSEVALIILLTVFALLVARRLSHKLGVFVFAGGLARLIYYGSLKIAVGWPASWMTQDCLLWIPRPWYGQIWIALVVSAGAVALGLVLLRGFGRYPSSS
ncbi:MAG: hypothetical protein KAW89_06105 [Armatimonadetes bacterium]|nr:hypothetical protein [Armatimonadota bacterium]